MPPIDEWIKSQDFKTTEDIKVPELLLDQVIGQDKSVEIVRKAAEQKRHVMLIGDPGTGKSMVARAMTAFLPKEELEDIMSVLDEDYQISRYVHLSRPSGAVAAGPELYRINGFEYSHVSFDSGIQQLV